MNSRYYQPLPHDVFDLCLPAVLGAGPLLTYFGIRRYLWTKISSSTRRVMSATREGHAVAMVAQAKVATSLGYTRRQTVSEHLRAAREHGWLKAEPLRMGGVCLYYLGRWGDVPDGSDPEAVCKKPKFFFDTWRKELRTQAGEFLRKEPGGYQRRFTEFSLADRERAVFTLLSLRLGRPISKRPRKARSSP